MNRSLLGLRRAPLVLATIGAVLSWSAPALASQSVSIDVGRIDVTDALAPGGEYKLPSFGVRNPGSESTTYRIVVTYIDGQDEARPVPAWFSFDPDELTLGPGESRPVQARITLPADAEPGNYAALIGPEIAGTGTGAQVGAAAAAHLTFTVAPSSWLDGVLRQLGRFFALNPWALTIPLLLAALIALAVVRRRFSFSVNRRA
jgi:hypothetical protein